MRCLSDQRFTSGSNFRFMGPVTRDSVQDEHPSHDRPSGCAQVIAPEVIAPKASPSAGAMPLRARPESTPMLGVALMVVSTIFFSLSDGATKALAGFWPAVEVAWIRCVVCALIMI